MPPRDLPFQRMEKLEIMHDAISVAVETLLSRVTVHSQHSATHRPEAIHSRTLSYPS